MTPIHFTQQAREDLRSIQSHYQDVAPASVDKVLSDIYSMLDILSKWPKVGRRVKGENFHQIATTKYRYVIAYQHIDERIEVEGIFRYQDRG